MEGLTSTGETVTVDNNYESENPADETNLDNDESGDSGEESDKSGDQDSGQDPGESEEEEGEDDLDDETYQKLLKKYENKLRDEAYQRIKRQRDEALKAQKAPDEKSKSTQDEDVGQLEFDPEVDEIQGLIPRPVLKGKTGEDYKDMDEIYLDFERNFFNRFAKFFTKQGELKTERETTQQNELAQKVDTEKQEVRNSFGKDVAKWNEVNKIFQALPDDSDLSLKQVANLYKAGMISLASVEGKQHQRNKNTSKVAGTNPIVRKEPDGQMLSAEDIRDPKTGQRKNFMQLAGIQR